MPGDGYRDLFDSLLGGLRNAAVATLPGCNVCGGTALPLPCKACGEHSCIDHAFINRRVMLICGQCAQALEVDFDDDEPQVADTDAERVDWAFSVLGLKRGATADEVNRAFRELALKHHPDRGGNSGDFSSLQEAKTVALEHLEGR
jgi:hypothetical protein